MLGAVRRLVGQVLTNTAPAWENASLLNSWASFVTNNYPTIGYRKLDNNMVEFRGMLTRATPGTTSVAFNVPAKYRPTTTKRFSSVDTSLVGIEINTNGDVLIFYTTGVTPSTAFVPLDVVQYVP